MNSQLHLVAHLQNRTSPKTQAKFCKRATKPTHDRNRKMDRQQHDKKKHEPVTGAWQNGGFSG
jgi:hypothetical protein